MVIFNSVNKPMFFINTPGPIAGIIMFERFWFAQSFKWPFLYIVNQFQNFKTSFELPDL